MIIMLDVTKEEPEVVMDSGCEAIRTERPTSKPYLKFGVSAILGLDVHHPQGQDNNGSFRSPEESSKLDIKAELFQHHSPVSSNSENEAKTFHPVYLHSYFHPLIQQAHSAGKHFSGESPDLFES